MRVGWLSDVYLTYMYVNTLKIRMRRRMRTRMKNDNFFVFDIRMELD